MLKSARTRIVIAATLAVGLLLSAALSGCGGLVGEKPVQAPIAPDGEHDPAVWGAQYPEVYKTWLATAEPRPAGKSKYKRGFDDGQMYDKLSEYPFMPLLFKGWGFGIDYQEPRGHYYMVIDQGEADPSRVKSGGACLTCKSPYVEDLYTENKDALFSATYDEAIGMLPEEHRELGASCIDCHDNETMELSTRRWTVESALTEIGVEPDDLSTQQQRLMVCGQCHVTYSVMKEDGAAVDVDFPWEGSEWGAITVENVIERLLEDPARTEWTQQVTGLKLGFIRHPDVEFFSAGSPHMKVGMACNDCHMPDIRVNNETISDHNLMSPLKTDMTTCKRCHADSAEELKAKVLAIQDANAALFINAGYQTATAAKLIEIANESLETSAADIKPGYDEAVAHYKEAFYRTVWMGAENSLGFHNPAEGERILKDAQAEADAATKLLRDLLASNGVEVPAEVPLELSSYLENRGEHKKGFIKAHYLPDPSGQAQKSWPKSLGEILQ
ncbi:MAG: ammonia-forming cytochrome c nitrite reductase subunit c552 [Coriobacteriia bacterium]